MADQKYSRKTGLCAIGNHECDGGYLQRFGCPIWSRTEKYLPEEDKNER